MSAALSYLCILNYCQKRSYSKTLYLGLKTLFLLTRWLKTLYFTASITYMIWSQVSSKWDNIKQNDLIYQTWFLSETLHHRIIRPTFLHSNLSGNMVELVETNVTFATTWWLLRLGNFELRQRQTLIRFLLTHWHCCSVVDDDGDGDGDCGGNCWSPLSLHHVMITATVTGLGKTSPTSHTGLLSPDILTLQCREDLRWEKSFFTISQFMILKLHFQKLKWIMQGESY